MVHSGSCCKRLIQHDTRFQSHSGSLQTPLSDLLDKQPTSFPPAQRATASHQLPAVQLKARVHVCLKEYHSSFLLLISALSSSLSLISVPSSFLLQLSTLLFCSSPTLISFHISSRVLLLFKLLFSPFSLPPFTSYTLSSLLLLCCHLSLTLQSLSSTFILFFALFLYFKVCFLLSLMPSICPLSPCECMFLISSFLCLFFHLLFSPCSSSLPLSLLFSFTFVHPYSDFHLKLKVCVSSRNFQLECPLKLSF